MSEKLAKPLPIFKETLGLEDYKEYYSHQFACDNCMKHQQVYVRMGQRLKGLHRECRNCGCEVKL